MMIFRRLTVVLLFVVCAVALATADSKPDRLKPFLRIYIGTADEETKSTEYSAAFVDLRGDGTKEALVYLSSDGWCGTGGCTLLILAQGGGSYRVVAKIPAVRLPIWVLPSKSNGWCDIGVVGRNSANEALYEAILSFDGKSYSNVSKSESRALHRKVEGKVVMSAKAKARPLYH